jgi:hypothetical protein
MGGRKCKYDKLVANNLGRESFAWPRSNLGADIKIEFGENISDDCN